MMAQLLLHLWGDYILQSDWMAQHKRKATWPCLVHVTFYSLPFFVFIVLTEHPHPTLAAFLIFTTHFLIDRFGMARYVVWLKNHIGPRGWCFYEWLGQEQRSEPRFYWPWRNCTEFGCTPNRQKNPAFMSAWLLIIADNTLHLTINYLALRYL